MVLSLYVNFYNKKSKLCEIGGKYDTDKSPQRPNVTDIRHCHPYTLFYDIVFESKKNDSLNIAELGILYGSSLLMWKEYFPNAKLYGFEYNLSYIDFFKTTFNNDNITLSQIDVKSKENIISTFQGLNVQYDIIIEDTTHIAEDQIRVIQNIYNYLKPGGIFIIEDIFKIYSEEYYIQQLQPILHHFSDYYFVSLDHETRNSTGWDNDKLFVLIKGGAEPIFPPFYRIIPPEELPIESS